ncbi:MAG: HTH-like domain-containing protein [Phycisphaerales bacterium]
MSAQELGNTLREMYDGADKGSAVVMIHLFGIKYATQIRESGANARDIVRAAGMNDSYATEIQKAIRLAEFVDVKPAA